jgi:hypothetical protein
MILRASLADKTTVLAPGDVSEKQVAPHRCPIIPRTGQF